MNRPVSGLLRAETGLRPANAALRSTAIERQFDENRAALQFFVAPHTQTNPSCFPAGNVTGSAYNVCWVPSRETALTRVASLTTRQRQILDLVLAGHPSKNIAADLGISQRTVDNHRAAIMRKTGSKSLPALVRTALAAA